MLNTIGAKLAVVSDYASRNAEFLLTAGMCKELISSLYQNCVLCTVRFTRQLHLLLYRELERNRIRLIDGLVFHGLDNLISLKLKRNVITELMDGAFWGLSRIQIL